MSKYIRDYTAEFKKDSKKIKSDFLLRKRLANKIEEILENPHHYKPLHNELKNKRRTHIGSFVLVFKVLEKEKVVCFTSFKHHDFVYKK